MELVFVETVELMLITVGMMTLNDSEHDEA